MLVVNVKNVDTLGQLKKMIFARNGLSVVGVYYRGVCLEDERKLAHLLPGMLNMGPPRFSVRTRLLTSKSSPEGISLFVKGLEGSTFQVHLPARNTVADLRAAIRGYEGYCTEQDFKISCNGRLLLAEEMALIECNVESGSLVKVNGRLLGGDAPRSSQRFVDMENMSALKTAKMYPIVAKSTIFESKTPEWEFYKKGLIVLGECKSPGCEAFRKQVCCNKGFTVFNIAEDSQCPMCEKNFKVTTCGFRGCQWMFEGRKTGFTAVDVMSKWNVTSDYEYQYFDEDGGRNMTEWSCLIITTKNLATDKVTGKRSLKPDCTKCAACFGTITALASALANRSENIAPCGHALHSDCAMELWREGYFTCPMCRDPMATPT